jgi:hypothetical protein
MEGFVTVGLEFAKKNLDVACLILSFFCGF